MPVKTSNMGEFVAVFLALAVVIGLIVTITHQVTTTPVVQVSHGSKECRAVIPESAGSCDDMPTRYSLEWVE